MVISGVINSDAHDTVVLVDSAVRSRLRPFRQRLAEYPSRDPDSLTGVPFFYSSAAFWNANLTGESSAFLKLDRWIIMINATPLFMSIQT